MKNLLVLSTLILLFSCGKDNNQGGSLDFPQKYVFTGLDFGETRVYKNNGNGYTKIPIAGSSIVVDDIVKGELESQETFSVPNFIEILDEENIRVEITFKDFGFTLDTIVTYSKTDNKIQLIDGDGVVDFTFEISPDNEEQSNFCVFTNWATRTKSDGTWDLTPISYSGPCPTDDDLELISQIEAANSFSLPLDTVALNFSNYIFELEE